MLGTNNWKHSTIQDHSKSEVHVRPAAIRTAKMGDKNAPAVKALDALNSATLSKMRILFMAAHFRRGGHIVILQTWSLTVQQLGLMLVSGTGKLPSLYELIAHFRLYKCS